MRISNSTPADASTIQVLKDVAAVRKRPGMYIGDDRDGGAMTHMALEVIGNALDQFLAGHASRMDIEIHTDGSLSVADDGVGIAVRDCDGKSFLERAFTELHFGPTADGHKPHEHLGLYGVGLAPVNALSSELLVVTHREGRGYRQEFREGVAQSALVDLGPSNQRGTVVRFKPDASILDCSWIDSGGLLNRLRELSWLNLKAAVGPAKVCVFLAFQQGVRRRHAHCL